MLRVSLRRPSALDRSAQTAARVRLAIHAKVLPPPGPHEPASTVSPMAASIDFTIAFESPDEEAWIVARVLEVPGAMSQGRTRDEARANALDALSTVLRPDEELVGGAPQADREHLRFTAAA